MTTEKRLDKPTASQPQENSFLSPNKTFLLCVTQFQFTDKHFRNYKKFCKLNVIVDTKRAIDNTVPVSALETDSIQLLYSPMEW